MKEKNTTKSKSVLFSVTAMIAVCLNSAVALGIRNTLIAVFSAGVPCLFLILALERSRRKNNSAEKYIASRSAKFRPLMQEINDLVLEAAPGAAPFIEEAWPCAAYMFLRPQDNMYHHLVSQQAFSGGRHIRCARTILRYSIIFPKG